MTTKTAHITRARLDRSGRLIRLSSSGKPGAALKPRFDPARSDHPEAFAPDADTPLLTRRELRELKPAEIDDMPDVCSLRRRLNLSQGAFSSLFGIPLGTIKDWEQGRRKPDAPARAYLRVIARDPKAVRRALRSAAE